jgi:polyhydroxyalkanoate synthesis regulator protein
MTDWTKQTEEMFKAWSEAQKKITESWAENVKGLGGAQSGELWEKALATWEETLEKSTKTQAEWTQKWIESLKSMQGMPEQAVASTERFQEMTQRWAAMQEQFWSNWFEMLRSLEPAKFSEKWGEAFQNPFQVWQNATKKVMDAQAEWLRVWMGSSARPADKPEGK